MTGSCGRSRQVLRRVSALVIVLLTCGAASGCGAVAAPCRVGSAALKVVPLVGHAAAAPTDACAEVIDPG